MATVRNDIGLVLDDPLDDFPFFELYGLSHSCRKIDVVLISGFLSFDQLNFSWISHLAPPG